MRALALALVALVACAPGLKVPPPNAQGFATCRTETQTGWVDHRVVLLDTQRARQVARHEAFHLYQQRSFGVGLWASCSAWERYYGRNRPRLEAQAHCAEAEEGGVAGARARGVSRLVSDLAVDSARAVALLAAAGC